MVMFHLLVAAHLKIKVEMAHPKLKAKVEMTHRDQVLMVMSHLKIKIKFPVLFTFRVRGVLRPMKVMTFKLSLTRPMKVMAFKLSLTYLTQVIK